MTAGLHAATLGASLPLHQITQVRMIIAGRCKAGISFWPTFRFSARDDKEPQPGAVRLVTHAEAASRGLTLPEAGAAAAAAPTGSLAPAADSPEAGSSNGAALPAGSPDGVGAGQQLLHISFTKDPPDEFNLGASFLCGLPFPCITIRTLRLEGTLDQATGALTLRFDADFLTQVGNKAPTSLPIRATLTTEAATAFRKHLRGERLAGGTGVLVSAAEVPKTPSWLANLLLWLPAAATAVLPVRFEWS